MKEKRKKKKQKIMKKIIKKIINNFQKIMMTKKKKMKNI
jgi:hypothetical protein